MATPLLYWMESKSAPGELVATHRKVHLFDIDIPGKIKFKVAYLPQLLYDGILSRLRKARR